MVFNPFARTPAAPAAEVAPRPPLYAVASGKGGVGKTWLAASLATTFADRGERVLLVDGDLGLANLDVQLGVDVAADLADVIAGEAELSDAICSVAGGAGAGGFDFVAGRSGHGALAVISDAELAGLRRGVLALADQYDRVLVDLGAGLDRAVTGFCSDAREVFLVMMDEPSSVSDAFALARVLSHLETPAKLRAVVNQADGARAGETAFEGFRTACREFLACEPALAGVIRRDSKVREALRGQERSVERHPLSPSSQDVRTLAATIAEA